MSTTIEINKQNVQEFLTSGKKQKFIIPEYQRPYAWTDEEVQTLFDDLVEHAAAQSDSYYFLGTIVSYVNENNEQEIIDGQQRITTLCLLLRALYAKIEKMTPSAARKNFMTKISSTLWEVDKITGEADKNKTLLKSKVFESKHNDVLREILTTGEADLSAKDNYSKNYLLCQNLIEQYAQAQSLNFYNFIYSVLEESIVLPIKADSQDSALTIFSTLNDRGLPLSDADIFKAKIYDNLSDLNKRDLFIREWQRLSLSADETDESIQKLFYYYMFYLRAKRGDTNSTTPGLRKYYFDKKHDSLFDADLMDNLGVILDFWRVVNNRTELEDQSWSTNFEILKILDILTSYPNEFWKYPVVNYYLQHKDSKDFEGNFLVFLRKLFVKLCRRYIVTPTVNAVKQDILNLNSEIIKTDKPDFLFKDVTDNLVTEELKKPHKNVVRMLLKLLAYDNEKQKTLLPEKWEIEHILPRKWQSTYFPTGIADDVINDAIELLGNKIPFEKKLNIVAGNGYFAKKKISYKQSNIALVQALSDSDFLDWKLEEIYKRNSEVLDKIVKIFKDWID